MNEAETLVKKITEGIQEKKGKNIVIADLTAINDTICSVKIKAGVLIGKLGYGVMVTQQILVLFFQVRILVSQQTNHLSKTKIF